MATMTYSGGGLTGNWSDPLNWSGGVAPGITDTALVHGGPGTTVTSTVSVSNIMLIGGETVTFDNTVNTYGLGACTGFMVCINSTAVFAPGSTLNDAGGALLVGVGGVGGFVAQGTASQATIIHSNNATIGKSAIASGTVTIDGATWNNDKVVFLGYMGQGALNVLNGGQVNIAGNLAMGFAAGAVGQATLSSGGTITVMGAAALGGGDPNTPFGTSLLTVNAGSLFDVKNLARVETGSAIHMAGGTVSVGDTSAWMTVFAGAQISGFGTVTTRAGGQMDNEGTIKATGGTLQINGVAFGQGTMQIGDHSTIAITAGSLYQSSIAFSGVDANLALAHGTVVKAEIDGFTTGDTISMAGIDHATWSSVAQSLTLSSAGHIVDTLHVAGSYAGDVFNVSQVNGVGVISVSSPSAH
jgi:T5SS/PEP-CTERM-associated repeat protein